MLQSMDTGEKVLGTKVGELPFGSDLRSESEDRDSGIVGRYGVVQVDSLASAGLDSVGSLMIHMGHCFTPLTARFFR